MKKYSLSVFILSFFIVPLFAAKAPYVTISLKISNLCSSITGGAIGTPKNIILPANPNLDKLYELIALIKSFIQENKTATQSIKSFFGGQDPSNIVKTLESITIDLVNTIKITKGIKANSQLLQQSNHLKELATKIDSLIPTIRSLSKGDVQSALINVANCIKNIANKAKNETMALMQK